MSIWAEKAERTLSNIPEGDNSDEAFVARGVALANLAHEKKLISESKEYVKAMEELDAAEEYASAGSSEFAKDELKHACHWIELFRQAAIDMDDKIRLQKLLAKYSVLKDRIA